MDQLKMSSRVAIGALAACSLFAVLAVVLGFAGSSQAALVESANGPQLLIGLDDDRQDNAAVQAGATANQSLNRTDVMVGGSGNDVMFGLNGNDVARRDGWRESAGAGARVASHLQRVPGDQRLLARADCAGAHCLGRV
jgi:RTX calcium-binding nonapeptide repeat (4 copies)